jgi:adenylate kinase
MKKQTKTKAKSILAKHIILFGPQGSGKGTQADLLVEKYGLKHISPGELFRAEVSRGTPLGKQLKDYMDKGLLVPKEINFKVVYEALKAINFTNFILDGFPRSQEQADYLETIAKIDAAIEIHISDEEAVKRISSRFMCEKCSAGYNTISIKPKKAGICDKCQGKLVQRADDTPEAVRKRLTIYHEQTEPLKVFYGNKKAYKEVNGEQEIAKVFKELEKALTK